MASLAIGSTLALAPATTRAQVQPTLSSAPPASAPQTPATVDTGTAVADGDQAQIGDIIVTAERRATTAQKTPISISVVSGGDLARTGTVDLAKAVEEVPAVQVQRSNTGASFYIRGIGSRGVGGSSPVSVNEDGI
ncbi:MAG: hypothetical protein EOP67_76230 [Sphingomonas sp.]|nr:MAG: hypothetical protein EOP67_76230 [Sphingomonas sp.]